MKAAGVGPAFHSKASGNPVRVGDGCATVTGYKPPSRAFKWARVFATGLVSDWEGRRQGSKPEVRISALAVLVWVFALYREGQLLRQREG